MEWYLAALKKYAVFEGRSRRMEYWMFVLFNILAGIALGIVDNVLGLTTQSGQGLLSGIYSLAVLVPGIAVGVRRLHDTGRSGWYLLLALIPIVGLIVLYWLILDSEPGTNQYGPNPKETGAVPGATTPAAAAAGWHPDPSGRHELRYWDGSGWTSHVSDGGVTGEDTAGV